MEAFCYHARHFEDETKAVANQQAAKIHNDRQQATPRVGELLLLYVDDLLTDVTPFGTVRSRAFRIMPEETLRSTGKLLVEKPVSQMDLRWQAVDKQSGLCTKNLRPLAMALDYVTVAAAELGNIADRRIYLSLNDTIEGLPKLLMRETGLNSGFMIPQYTTAALVSENKSFCFPASADSIPTSLGQEDHVSMGSISARKALMVIENLEKILGIELFCAAQGFDFRKPVRAGGIIDECHSFVRQTVPFAESDHIMSQEMNKAIDLVRNKTLITVSGKAAKKLKIDLKNENHELFGIY